VQVSFDEGNDTVELQRLVHIHEDSSWDKYELYVTDEPATNSGKCLIVETATVSWEFESRWDGVE
jgi:hypothetical protein